MTKLDHLLLGVCLGAAGALILILYFWARPICRKERPMTLTNPLDAKPWWQSTTLQGSIVAALSAAIPILKSVFKIDLGDAASDVSAVFTVIGLVMVVVGRFKATKPLG